MLVISGRKRQDVEKRGTEGAGEAQEVTSEQRLKRLGAVDKGHSRHGSRDIFFAWKPLWQTQEAMGGFFIFFNCAKIYIM